MEQKRGGHEYQLGEVASLATKLKAFLTNYEQGMNIAPLHALNLLHDHKLLYIAHTCDIDKGTNSEEQTRNLAVN